MAEVFLEGNVEKGAAVSRQLSALSLNRDAQTPSARIPAVNQLPDVFMVDQFATVGGRQSLFYFAEKPLVVIDELLDCLLHECLRIPTPLIG
jgi:hypothetical protein